MPFLTRCIICVYLKMKYNKYIFKLNMTQNTRRGRPSISKNVLNIFNKSLSSSIILQGKPAPTELASIENYHQQSIILLLMNLLVLMRIILFLN